MTRSAAFFLILLRLAIGWHFLVEGFQKLPSEQLTALGLPTNNKSFSSSGYFREAAGPLGSGIRALSGDPDVEALSRLEVMPLGDGDAKGGSPAARVPRGTMKDWVDYLQRFRAYYALDEGQKEQADGVLEKAKTKLVALLTYVPDPDPSKRDKQYDEMTTEQTRVYTSGEFKRRMTLVERIADYKAKLAALQQTPEKMWLFGKDVEGARLRAAKAEVAQVRAGLLSDLDKQTQAYKDGLDKILTQEQKDKGPIVIEKPRNWVDLIDRVTPWMLTGVGACLLLGLFSRLSAFVAAGFLLMTYLAVPAFPWLPAPPTSEGSYLFVNKNVIEMLALMVLMCLPTGRWFGADGLLYALTGPFRRKTTTS